MSTTTHQVIAKLGLGTAIVAFALGLNYIYAWTEPAQTPPGGNVEPPINTSSIDQDKTGGLTVGDFGSFGTAFIQNSLNVGGVTPVPAGRSFDVLGNAYVQGNLGVGITAPPAGTKLEVQGGAIKATGGLIIETRTSDPASPATGQMWLRTDL